VITCRELADFLMSYLEGELPPQERARFEEHLAVCPTCVRYVHTYQLAVRMGRESYREPEAPVPGDVPERLVTAILAARPKR
jgi:anti-sigma factor RsiW